MAITRESDMPKLKYKNGSTWTELNLGGVSLDNYPVNSIYYGPGFLGLPNDTNTNYNYNPSPSIDSILSPAVLLGGTWARIFSNLENTSYKTCNTPLYAIGTLGKSVMGTNFNGITPSGNAYVYSYGDYIAGTMGGYGVSDILRQIWIRTA